jgi:hypothetical protein
VTPVLHLSSRFAIALAVLLGLALIPTLIHSYGNSRESDGLSTTSIPANLVGFSSVPSGRGPNWGAKEFDSTDWIERNYVNGGDDVRLTVIRSYDLKTLYHHPELAVAYGGRYGSSFARHEVRRLTQRPDVPVHVLFPSPSAQALALYVLHYDGKFVADPIWFQLRTSLELLLSRRRPMTLFFAHDLSAPDGIEPDTLPASALLFAAIDRFTNPVDRAD